jgi:hypothetical protein
MRLLLHCFNKNVFMDEATLTYLVHHRMKIVPKQKQFDIKYKDKILELTTLLMTTKMNGALQEAFETYASECISHFQQQNQPSPVLVMLECDTLMYPKKVCMFKNKNKTLKE